MSNSRTTTAPAPMAAPAPHIVVPTGVYSPGEVIAAFHLRTSSLRREIRLGRLRVAKRCGRYYFLGSWLLAWLEGGELKRSSPSTNGTGHTAAPAEQS